MSQTATITPQYTAPVDAKMMIWHSVKDYSPENQYHFPALLADIKLDSGRIAIDLGYQEDFFEFASELDKLMLGESRFDLSGRNIKNSTGGINLVYPFYFTEKPRILVHVWIYTSSGNQNMDWHIRGHEEGHVINMAVSDLQPLKQHLRGANLVRYNAESLPQELGDYALRKRGTSYEEIRKFARGVQVDSGDYSKKLYDIKQESELEDAIVKSAVFFKGTCERRKRDGCPIGEHVKEVLDYIDQQGYDKKTRTELRLIAFLHDLGKQVTNHASRSNRLHGDVSALMAEDFALEKKLIDIIRYHDYHFYAYRELKGQETSKKVLRRSAYIGLMVKADVDFDLMLKFNNADSTKRDTAAVKWFEHAIEKLRKK